MGLLVDGKWHDVWYDTKASKGRFVRSESQFRNWVTRDGSPGPSGRGGFRAEPNRYHLYVAFACPWAHRTLIMRKLKGLESLIGVSAVNSYMGPEGWTFAPGPEMIPDSVNRVERLYELYALADPTYSGRATVPILWDKHEHTIVSNESASDGHESMRSDAVCNNASVPSMCADSSCAEGRLFLSNLRVRRSVALGNCFASFSSASSTASASRAPASVRPASRYHVFSRSNCVPNGSRTSRSTARISLNRFLASCTRFSTGALRSVSCSRARAICSRTMRAIAPPVVSSCSIA